MDSKFRKDIYYEKNLFLITIFICFLTSCTGIDSRRIEKILDSSDCFYNDEYGIELNKLYAPCYSSGYITTDSGELEVFVLWRYSVEKIEFYNKGNIGFDLESEEDYFKYFSSEVSRDNIIMTGNIKYDDNNIIIEIIDSSITVGFDEITLEAK